jgi:hypothetical protein
MVPDTNEELCGQIRNILLRAITSLYIEYVALIRKEKRNRPEAQSYIMLYHVSRVFPLS